MKLKKVLALALATTMTFSLVGCGGSTDTAAEAPAEETTEEAPAEEATEEAPAEEATEEAPASEGLAYKGDLNIMHFLH